VPTKPPSDRTRAAFRRPELAEGHSSPDFWIRPNYAKRTQSEPTALAESQSRCTSGNQICPAPTVPPPRISSKRTQFAPTTTPSTCEKCKTNPIPIYHVSNHPLFLRNEPNLPPRPPAPHQKCETNPISSPLLPRASILRNEPNLRQFRAYHAGRRSFPARRGTQFTTTNIHSTIYNSLAQFPLMRTKCKWRLLLQPP